MTATRRAGTGASLGLDIGGTTVRAAVQEPSGTIVHEVLVPSRPLAGNAVAGLADLVTSVCRDAGTPVSELAAIGIGLPGAVHPSSGRVHSCPAFPELHDVDVAPMLERRLGTRVVIDNDADLAAWAEYLAGGHGVRTLACLALGTGVGLGLVVDGRVLHGEHGAAGEIAEMPVRVDGHVRPLESIVSVAGLLDGNDSHDPADVPRLVREAARGDGPARRAVHRYCRPLADAVAALTALLDPGVVVMTGGLGSRPIVVQTLRGLLAGLAVEVPVVISRFEDRAPLVGALALARRAAVPDGLTQENGVPSGR